MKKQRMCVNMNPQRLLFNGLGDSSLPNVYINRIEYHSKLINFYLTIKCPNYTEDQFYSFLKEQVIKSMTVEAHLFIGDEGNTLYQ